MSYVFISYNENSRELADRVRNQLDSLGMATWVRDNAIDWDQEENAAILIRAIQAASALLIIVPRDEGNVDRISKDVHHGYQFEKPVFMLRRFEELPAFLQRLSPLVSQRTEYSPLPQPLSDDALMPPSFFERYGLWIAAALMVSILVAGSVFVFISQQSPPPSTLATLAPTEPASPTPPPSETTLPLTPTLAAFVPSQTSTLVAATLTASPLPPSATATANVTPTTMPSVTSTATSTSLPSATATLRALPSLVPSLVPTVTPLPLPTQTATPTLTATPTPLPASPTPLPEGVGVIVTATLFAPTFTPMPTAVASSSACPPPAGWIAYSVRAGDTLFSIAGRAGSNVEAVRAANCLSDANVIAVGQTLYLPAPTTATPTPTNIVLVVEGCDVPGVVITAPLAVATLDGIIEVRGTASIADFSYYRLEIRPLAQSTYTQITQVSLPVIDNLLWRVDTNRYPVGIYYLRLTVVTRRGTFPPSCTIPVIFG